jgi:DNA polymerase I-like protein with 3'-5' exonuclease and polymerase domains
MLGIDFSGLELRVLGHYLHSFDNGQFIKILLESDIHTANQRAVGLDTRNQAKTFIYAYIYGAGNEKLGLITGGNNKEGKRLRDNFEKKLPALKYLKQAVSNAYHNKKFLRGLDSRKLMCRSEHSALNTLIQSAGAIIVKKGTVLLNEKLQKNNFVWGEDYAMVLHVHDEMQFIVRKDRVDEFKTIAESIFNDTQVAMNFRCKLDGEIKVGQNWSETH